MLSKEKVIEEADETTVIQKIDENTKKSEKQKCQNII